MRRFRAADPHPVACGDHPLPGQVEGRLGQEILLILFTNFCLGSRSLRLVTRTAQDVRVRRKKNEHSPISVSQAGTRLVGARRAFSLARRYLPAYFELHRRRCPSVAALSLRGDSSESVPGQRLFPTAFADW